MLIYEKDNKLNISFENNMEDTDIEIGKDEVKIGEATISENNVLPTPTNEDVGKVPTVQEDGSYALANAGGSNAPLICINTEGTLDKTMGEIQTAYVSGRAVLIRDGVRYFSASELAPVTYDEKDHAYYGNVQTAFEITYFVSEASEAAALDAYPTIHP